jgi:hypothetical protein
MQPTAIYPEKPSKILNIHFHLSANADERMKSHLRESLYLLSVLDLAEHDPERPADVIITDSNAVLDVLRDTELMFSVTDNVWVIMQGGKMPELIAESPNPKVRRIDLSYVHAAVLGQMTMLITLHNQECTDTTQVLSTGPRTGEFTAAA